VKDYKSTRKERIALHAPLPLIVRRNMSVLNHSLGKVPQLDPNGKRSQSRTAEPRAAWGNMAPTRPPRMPALELT
jgi:hypothetical protein